MADANRGDRPLSPFMIGPYYRPQITSMMSIGHRITGVGLTLGMMMAVWWILAAATSADAFETASAVLTSWGGYFVWLCVSLALSYHLLNGIRHLVWDTVHGFEIANFTRSGIAVLICTVVLTAIIWIAA